MFSILALTAQIFLEIDDVCQPLLTIPNNIRVTESDVKKVFSQLKPRKACGPDGVGGNTLVWGPL